MFRDKPAAKAQRSGACMSVLIVLLAVLGFTLAFPGRQVACATNSLECSSRLAELTCAAAYRAASELTAGLGIITGRLPGISVES